MWMANGGMQRKLKYTFFPLVFYFFPLFSLGWKSLVCEDAGWTGRDGHCVEVLNDILYVIGGTDDPFLCKNDVWQSMDGGASWLQLLEHAPWRERWQHSSCTHNGRIYLTGGWGGLFAVGWSYHGTSGADLLTGGGMTGAAWSETAPQVDMRMTRV